MPQAPLILTPYPATPTQSTITELYVDPTTLKAKVQWSKASTISSSGTVVLGTSSYSPGDLITIPTALAVGGTYLIWSEVSYKYVPAVGYLMAKTGITLKDLTYTRPRQSSCVMYKTTGLARHALNFATAVKTKGRAASAAFQFYSGKIPQA